MDSEHFGEYELRKFSPRMDPDLLPGLIRCYQRVFADQPWGEWMRCELCGKAYGSEHASDLQIRNFKCCNTPLQEFWPASLVGQDLNRELNASHASCWIALHHHSVVGFCWGYVLSPEKLEVKLELPGLAEIIRSNFDCEVIAYQDEIGVLLEHRQKGVAKQLFNHRLDDFRTASLDVGVVRTKQFPPSVTYDWFTSKLDYKSIASYASDDGRVVLGRRIDTLSGA